METITTKQQLIDWIRQERGAWEQTLAEIGEARMMQPGAMGSWTFKDLVAHVTAWWRNDLRKLEAARKHEPLGPPAWPADSNLEQINQWIYDTNKDLSLDQVLRDNRATLQDFEELVRALSEQDLFEPGRIAWMDGRALHPQFFDDFVGHYPHEHEASVRGWLEEHSA